MIKLELKLGIPYKKGAPDMFWIEGKVVIVIEWTVPLPEIVGVGQL
jgi:hypothetical protein